MGCDGFGSTACRRESRPPTPIIEWERIGQNDWHHCRYGRSVFRFAIDPTAAPRSTWPFPPFIGETAVFLRPIRPATRGNARGVRCVRFGFSGTRTGRPATVERVRPVPAGGIRYRQASRLRDEGRVGSGNDRRTAKSKAMLLSNRDLTEIATGRTSGLGRVCADSSLSLSPHLKVPRRPPADKGVAAKGCSIPTANPSLHGPRQPDLSRPPSVVKPAGGTS